MLKKKWGLKLDKKEIFNIGDFVICVDKDVIEDGKQATKPNFVHPGDILTIKSLFSKNLFFSKEHSSSGFWSFKFRLATKEEIQRYTFNNRLEDAIEK